MDEDCWKMNIGTKEQGRDQTSLIRPLVGLSLVVSLALAGCSHAPEYSIFGSFFPVWIFCSIGGLILATCGRAVIARTAMAEHLVAPVLLYISTAVFLACVLWLIFYS